MLASSFFDPVLGIDIHFEMVPLPAPPGVPTPIPNPFIGIILDPIGLAAGLVIGAIVNAVLGAPITGPVFYWTLFPATNTGTEAKNIPGHILIPPGIAWAPFPKTPKPVIHPGETPAPGLPVKPENDAVVITGSKTVTVMGSNAVRLLDIALSCSEPLRLPSSLVLAVPKGAPIIIGGPPSLDLLAAFLGSLRTRFVSDSLHALLSRLKPSRFRNLLNRIVCFFTGHPVDVASGKVMTEAVDVDLPGPLPLTIERVYSSAFASRPGPVGHGWSLSIDQAVWRERGKVVLLAEDGREIEFDTFDMPGHRIEPGQQVYNPIERLTLYCEDHGHWRVVETDGGARVFAPPPGRVDGRAMIRRIVSPCEYHEIQFNYDASGELAWIRDSAGRKLRVNRDDAGRISELLLPRASGEGHDIHRRYRYDQDGDLVEVVDALGSSWRFDYVTHLLTQETDRTGMSFYFAYDGLGEDAWCVRTWGDGGLYDHVIGYDKANHITYVTNSLGQTTQYHMNLIGQVVKIVDPLGGVQRYEYDLHTLQWTRDIDPLGRVIELKYDDRGNVVERRDPDGTVRTMAYDRHDRLVGAVDAIGGKWSIRYDAHGRAVEKTDPCGGRLVHVYADGQLVAIDDARGDRVDMRYDAQGNIIASRDAVGGERKFRHDALGRLIAAIEINGRTTQLRRDGAGRITEIDLADGNTRRLKYDAEGHITDLHDASHDVRLTYAPLGRIRTRTHGGVAVHFDYDSEQQLTAITNALGFTYRFEYDLRGDVIAEYGFDTRLRRRFIRDAAGRIAVTHLPGHRRCTYEYDGADRVTAVQHDDGTRLDLTYRGDGTLMTARNPDSEVRFELDALGRVTRELQGDHWVASTYDRGGLRTLVRSSLGANLRFDRRGDGEVVEMAYHDASPEGADTAWEARITRDVAGAEVDRRLPGGLRSSWRRDAEGRAQHHLVRHEGRTIHDVSYEWRSGPQIHRLIDRRGGVVEYGHDAAGALAWAAYGDDIVELRMPDALGNLFRTRERTDRAYGPSGEVLWADTDRGRVYYNYDEEGSLIEKIEPDGKRWQYKWDATGMLRATVRPDGDVVTFTYDPFGRRIRKQFRGQVTHWIWDRNAPLHEWMEIEGAATPAPAPPRAQEPTWKLRRDEGLAAHPPIGPPPAGAITWIFEAERPTPAAKVVGGHCYSIVADHLGAPVAMLNSSAEVVWQAKLSVYGELREICGEPQACPFRWPGQYEDVETGLHYNHFRYYDPETGTYISEDPIGLRGGLELRAYTHDPTTLDDVLGLAGGVYDVYVITDKKGNPIYVGITDRGSATRMGEHEKTGRYKPKKNNFITLESALTEHQARGMEQALMEDLNTKVKSRRGKFPGNIVDSVAAHRLDNPDPNKPRDTAFSRWYKEYKIKAAADARETIKAECGK
jgi:RHS repeat-associated protein